MPSPAVVQTASSAYQGNIFVPNFRIGWSGYGNPGIDVGVLNAGASSFVGSVPSGFTAWDTSGATTWDPSELGTHMSLSGGNLTATKAGSSAAWSSVVSNTAKTGGKWYFEISSPTISAGQIFSQIFGAVNASFAVSGYVGQANSVGAQSGETALLGPTGSWPGSSYVQGDTCFVAVDLVAGKIYFASSAAPTNWNNVSGNPATGTGGVSITTLSSETEAAVQWGSQPTLGNLLVIAGIAYNSPGVIPINGWEFFQPPYQVSAAAGTFSFVIFKYAGASELLTQQVLTNGNQVWGLSAFEIDNVSGNPWTDIVSATLGSNQTSSTTPNVTVPVNAGTSLVLAVAAGNTPSHPITATYSGNSGAWTTGSLFTSSVADPQVGYYDWAVAGYANLSGGNANPTVTISVGGFSSFVNIVQIGGGPAVGIDPGSVASALVGATLSSPGGSITANTSLNTFGPNEVVIIDVVVGSVSAGGTPTVAITAAGLTFAQRMTSSIPGTHAFFWRYWAEAPTALTALACAVQVTWSGTPGASGVGLDVYAVGGAAAPSSPWDPDASLPKFSTSLSTITFNTTDGPDLILNAAVNTSSGTPPTFTNNRAIVGTGNGSNVASTQSSFLPTLASAGAQSSTVGAAIATLIYADAISGAIPPATATGTAAGAGAAAAIGTTLRSAVGSAAGHGAATSFATGILPATGRAAGVSGVVGVGNVLGVLEPLFDWEATVISQYQTSPTLLQLIENMETYIDPLTNLDAFYVNIWNIYSASGYGLDVLGRIVGVKRTIRVPTPTKFLGFESAAPSVESYDFGILFDGSEALTQNYTLSDQAFRTLILAKALANICNGSIPAMNQILINLFNGKGYGNVYVTDGEDMTMTITFTNAPSAVDLAIISTSGVFPRPAGVDLSVVT